MDKEKMGKFLTQLRNDRNMRQQDEAEIFQVSPQAISKWESGDSIPDIAILEKLANFYGVGIDEIINGERKAVAAPANEETKSVNGGKHYYGIFVYGMAALVIGLVFAFIPFLSIYMGQTKLDSGSGQMTIVRVSAILNLYQVLFKVSDSGMFVLWIAALCYIFSTLTSIGTWLHEGHRKVYWWFGFALALAAMVLMPIGWEWVAADADSQSFQAGAAIVMILNLAYFVMYLTLPCSRHKTYFPSRTK